MKNRQAERQPILGPQVVSARTELFFGPQQGSANPKGQRATNLSRVFLTLLFFAACAARDTEDPLRDRLSNREISQRVWDGKVVRLPTQLPNFDLPQDLAKGHDVTRWQTATVIVRTSRGYGSGVLLTSSRWVLTNYHVVAELAQELAVSGSQPPQAELLTCEAVGPRIKKRTESLKAVVYKVDPVRDLALLKIATAPAWAAELPYLDLASDSLRVLDECYVVGSQAGGPAWAVRPGEVISVCKFPDEFTDYIQYQDETGAELERNSFLGVVSNCPVSAGDSGGPLINERGELAAVTMGGPVNRSSGAIGYHVDASEIRRFLERKPQAPELVPLDPWTGGMPSSIKAEPDTFLFQQNGKRVSALIYRFCDASDMAPKAQLLFLDFEPEVLPPSSKNQNGSWAAFIPRGLWGMENRGAFHFDVFLLARSGDGVLVTGFVDSDELVNEIRIDKDLDHKTDRAWVRNKGGSWSLIEDPNRPIHGSDKLEPEYGVIMESIIAGLSTPLQGNNPR